MEENKGFLIVAGVAVAMLMVAVAASMASQGTSVVYPVRAASENCDNLYAENSLIWTALHDINEALFSASWWDENWSRRRPITITGSQSENYQLKIVIPRDSDMRSDYGDLRFLENENAGVLSYWVENYTADNATVWVRRLENVDDNIYMYYGNSSAASQSNVNDVFIRVIDNLVAGWSFNDNTGTVAYDNSGNGNNGTLTNGPTWTSGKFGSAVNFDGTDDYVSVPDADSLDFTTEMTVMAWVKLDDITATYGVANKSGFVDGEFPAWTIGYSAYWGRFTFGFREDDGTVFSSTAPTTGTWYHIAATLGGAEDKIYVNGVLEEYGDYLTPIEVTDYPLYIGTGSNSGGPSDQYFNGTIDEVKIYSKALSVAEVVDENNCYGYVTPHLENKVLVRKLPYSMPTASMGGEETFKLLDGKLDSPLAVTTTDQTENRALETIYQNTTGKALWVNSFLINVEDDMGTYVLEISPNAAMSASIAIDRCVIGGGEYHYRDKVCGHIHVDYYYRIRKLSGYWAAELVSWIEQTLG